MLRTDNAYPRVASHLRMTIVLWFLNLVERKYSPVAWYRLVVVGWKSTTNGDASRWHQTDTCSLTSRASRVRHCRQYNVSILSTHIHTDTTFNFTVKHTTDQYDNKIEYYTEISCNILKNLHYWAIKCVQEWYKLLWFWSLMN